ncbi:hypothetical protein ACHAWF_010427 [Thalassiosira exigua]
MPVRLPRRRGGVLLLRVDRGLRIADVRRVPQERLAGGRRGGHRGLLLGPVQQARRGDTKRLQGAVLAMRYLQLLQSLSPGAGEAVPAGRRGRVHPRRMGARAMLRHR